MEATEGFLMFYSPGGGKARPVYLRKPEIPKTGEKK